MRAIVLCFPLRLQNLNLKKKTKWILVVVGKCRYHENVLLKYKNNQGENCKKSSMWLYLMNRSLAVPTSHCLCAPVTNKCQTPWKHFDRTPMTTTPCHVTSRLPFLDKNRERCFIFILFFLFCFVSPTTLVCYFWVFEAFVLLTQLSRSV